MDTASPYPSFTYMMPFAYVLILLAAAISAWAHVERQVMFLYAYLMGLELQRIEGASAPIHPVALQV